MGATTRRLRWEGTEWVPQCPHCGGLMEGPGRLMGDSIGPRESAASFGAVASCLECGRPETIGPDTQWVSADQARG